MTSLRLAMEASRQQTEGRAPSPPLAERSDQQLLEQFESSCIVPALRKVCPLQQALQPPLRQPLLQLLELERKCTLVWCASGSEGVGTACMSELVLRSAAQGCTSHLKVFRAACGSAEEVPWVQASQLKVQQQAPVP